LILGSVNRPLVNRDYQEERRALMIVTGSLEFQAREYGIAIDQGFLFISLKANIKKKVLTDDLQFS
jgi:hypothetical protein